MVSAWYCRINIASYNIIQITLLFGGVILFYQTFAYTLRFFLCGTLRLKKYSKITAKCRKGGSAKTKITNYLLRW